MAGTRVFHWGAMEGAAFGALGGADTGRALAGAAADGSAFCCSRYC